MKRRFALFCIACAAALALGCSATGYTSFSSRACFSDGIMFSAKMLGARADYAYKRAVKVLDDIDAAASLTRENSELSRFNRAAAGERIEVGRYTYEMFALACEYYSVTNGAFNAAAAPLSRLWHVDARALAEYLPELGGAHISVPLPTKAEVDGTLSYCDPTSVTAEQSGGKYYLTKSDGRTCLDFGGIAKGYAIDECVRILDEYEISSALLDISGNTYFYGRYRDGSGKKDWNVGIISPRPRAAETVGRGYICAVSLHGDVSAVTSGDYNRYAIHDGADGALYIPHIICASGAPVGVEYGDNGWTAADDHVISATVIGESSTVCDILSTAVCALGLEQGAELLRKVGYKGLIFTEKRYTIVGDVRLYKPDEYRGYREYEYAA